MSQLPILSIIIPTHNRRAMLQKNLMALSRQLWPVTEFEVVVVADACQDGTVEMVADFSREAPYHLRVLSHEAKSAAATRNLGAANAQGKVLLFLDDDVLAQPELVQAHMENQHPQGVVLGYSKPMLSEKPSWWQYDARRWWEDTFRRLRQPGHRFCYRDFFSGNVSLSAALFHQVGGFDLSITGRLEDYELGMRLLKTGVQFHYVPKALGYHFDHTDLAKWLRRIRQEGVADIQIGQRHSELRTSMFGFTKPTGRWTRLLHTLAFNYPQRGDRLEQLLLRQAELYERLRWRGRWQKTVWSLRQYNYWRGVAATIGGQQKLSAWLQEAPMPLAVASNAPVIDLATLPSTDILQGILEQATRIGLRLALGDVEVLTIPPQPGAEPLREEHLQRVLRNLVKEQFVPALALHLIRSTGGGLPC